MNEEHGVRQIVQREIHLNSLAYLIIAVLVGLVALLTFMVTAEVGPPEWWLLDSEFFRVLFPGLLLMFILYMVDQHQRLRAQLLATHGQLEEASTEMQAAYERLAFAQHAAELMTSLEQTDALEQVLRESATHFHAEAAAVVGDDITIYTVDGVEDETARSAVLQVALDAVRAGKPLSVSDPGAGPSAIAVPLRYGGQLRSVVCLWRREQPFEEDHLEGLGLIARIIELSAENRMLLGELNDRLSGTLQALSALIDGRVPGYVKRSDRLAEQAVTVGRALGMSARELTDLRIAATLTDVGMLDVPESILSAKRSLTPEEIATLRLHPNKGAEVAQRAGFSPAVQEAIRDHHERLDGSGYPRRRSGEQIGLSARVLAVCDTYAAMTTSRPHRPRLTVEQAARELIHGAGPQFDRAVVKAFLTSIGYPSARRISASPAPSADEAVRAESAAESLALI